MLLLANLWNPCAFLPSFMEELPWVGELMLSNPSCCIPKESLLFRGAALLKPPFMLLSERRRLLVLGLGPNKFSCSIARLWTFFFSCEREAGKLRPLSIFISFFFCYSILLNVYANHQKALKIGHSLHFSSK